MLFNAIFLQQIATAVVAFITVAMLLNVRRYLIRRAESKQRVFGTVNTAAATKTAAKETQNTQPDPLFLDSREIAKQNAQKQQETIFNGTFKPEAISKWEIEFFELTREMTAKLDVKMSAISTLTHDANRVCQRMERLIEQLDQLVERQSHQIQMFRRMHQTPQQSLQSPHFSPERQYPPHTNSDEFESRREISEKEKPFLSNVHMSSVKPDAITNAAKNVTSARLSQSSQEQLRSHLSKTAYEKHSKSEPVSERSRSDIFVHDSSQDQPASSWQHESGNNDSATGSLFSRLTSIPDLDFSDDINDLTALDSEIFADDDSYERPEIAKSSQMKSRRSERMKPHSTFKDVHESMATTTPPISTFHSPYSQPGKEKRTTTKQPLQQQSRESEKKTPAANPKSQTLGELLLQNTRQEQAAKLQATPHITTAQQTIEQQTQSRRTQPQSPTVGKEALFMPISEK